MAYGDSAYWDAYAKRQQQVWEQQPSKLYSVTSQVPGMPKDGLGLFPTNAQVAAAGLPVGGSVARSAAPVAAPVQQSRGSAAGGGGAALDPWIAYQLQKEQEARRLALTFQELQAKAGEKMAREGWRTQGAELADQFNRGYATMPTQFLARGMADSGIGRVVVQRFNEDYRTAVNQINLQYQNTRSQLLQQLAQARAEAGQGDVNSILAALESSYTNALGQ